MNYLFLTEKRCVNGWDIYSVSLRLTVYTPVIPLKSIFCDSSVEPPCEDDSTEGYKWHFEERLKTNHPSIFSLPVRIYRKSIAHAGIGGSSGLAVALWQNVKVFRLNFLM